MRDTCAHLVLSFPHSLKRKFLRDGVKSQADHTEVSVSPSMLGPA